MIPKLVLKQGKQFYFFLKKMQLLLVFFQYVKKFIFIFFIFILNLFFDSFLFATMLDELVSILFMLFNPAGIAQYFILIHWFNSRIT